MYNHAAGSIGRRGGGRRDGGGVYPTAAAALGLGMVYPDLDETSERIGSSGSSTNNAGGDFGVSGVNITRRSFPFMGGRGGGPGAVTTGGATSAGGGGVAGSTISDVAVDGVSRDGGPGASTRLRGAAATGGGVYTVGDGVGADGGVGGTTLEEGVNNSNHPSTSWYSRHSSRVDMAALLGRNAETSTSGPGAVSASAGVAGGPGGGNLASGSAGSGGGWLGRIGGGGGAGAADRERQKVVTVVMTKLEANQIEIVEVARAVVIE